MLIIARAALVPYEDAFAKPAFPVRAFAPDDVEGGYLSQVAEKILSGDGSRKTRLREGDGARALFAAFLTHPFAEAADGLLGRTDEALRAGEAPAEGFDLALFSFEYSGDPHLCMARLSWKPVLLHRDDADGEGAFTARIARGSRGMPAPSGKDVCGFVINLSTGEIRLKDAEVPCADGHAALFASVLFGMEETRTEKEAVRAVREALREEAPAGTQPRQLEPAVRRAMTRAIEETGTIDVERVAREVFSGEPEGEKIARRVAERVREEEIGPVVPVESRRVARGLQRLKLRTDTGIAITLPASLAEDAASFSVTDNPDGTISIYIGKIGELLTE